jgi:hypothetical protein
MVLRHGMSAFLRPPWVGPGRTLDANIHCKGIQAQLSQCKRLYGEQGGNCAWGTEADHRH